jgi:hypothetical protein
MYSIVIDLKATKMVVEEKLFSLVFTYRSLYDKTDRFYDNSVRNTGFMTTLSGITSGRR